MAEQYLPLYRKYRPQTFEDLVGQENLVKAFTNAINTGKIAHAYLFCGPRGTGKTSSARILAKSLNCQEGPTLTPCGKCPCCLDILNGNMLDVVEMDAASNRSVEDAQNIIDKIHYAPVNGRYKIFIIDEVHMISKTAFNALLKTLEEPPENVIFILATTEPQKVLETIISRCQRFDFRRITTLDIVNRLKYISEKENLKISEDALLAIAKSAQGGMRDALALLDQISTLDVENEITVEKVNEILGKIDTDTLFEIAQSIFEKSVEKTVQQINTVYSKGNEPLQIIENLIQYYRNLSIIKTCKDEKTVNNLTLLSPQTTEFLKKQAENTTISEIAQIIEKLSYYYKGIRTTNNRYLWLELCFIDIASGNYNTNTVITNTQPVMPQIKIERPIQQTQIIQEIKQPKPEPTTVKPELKNEQKPEENEIIKELEEKETPTPSQISQPQQKVETPQNANSSDAWKNLLSLFDSLTARSFFNTFAKPVEMNEQKVIVTFKNETLGKRAQEQQKFDALKKACLKYYNVAKIDIEIRTGSAPTSPKIQENNVQTNDVSPQTTGTTQPQQQNPITEQPQINISQPPNEIEIDDETIPTEEITTTKINNNYSDQVKMAIDLFNAKVFE